MPKVILGITGGIASGKSTVLHMLARWGFQTVSSDDLAHHCIRKGQPAYSAILRVFGREILAPNNEIDRRKLGTLVFASPAQRRRLEKIVHPCVAKGLLHFIQTHKGMMALDIPLLFEARYQSWVDKIVVVYCTRAQQIKRLTRRRGLSHRQALQRIRAQMSLSRKCRQADYVIRNTRDTNHLRKQVSLFLSHLKKA